MQKTFRKKTKKIQTMYRQKTFRKKLQAMYMQKNFRRKIASNAKNNNGMFFEN